MRKPTTRGWVSVMAAGLVLAAGLVVGVTPLVAPGAASSDAGMEVFSVDRAFEHVEALAGEPRPMGSPAAAQARDYIESQLRLLGLAPETQSLTAPDYYRPYGPEVEVVNVTALIPGHNSSGAIVVMGHYDTVPATPGANDDAAAVASLLEAGRAILAGPPLRNDVILLFTDGEEPTPRYGSTAFVADAARMRDVAFVVNLEAIGGSGPSTLIEISGASGWLIDAYSDVASSPASFSFLTDVMEALGGGVSDFDPFRDAGVPGLHFAYHRGSSIYHTPADTLDRVSRDSLAHHGSQALAVVRHVGSLDLSERQDDGELVWITAGRTVLSHPAEWALPLALAVLLAAALVVAARARRFGSVRSLVHGVWIGQLATAAGVLMAWAVWRWLASIHGSLSVLVGYVYLVVLIGVASGIYFATAAWLGRRMQGDLLAGHTIVWALLGVAVTMAVPGAGYVFVWLACGGAVLVAVSFTPWPDSAERRMGRFAILAAITVPLLAAPVDVFFQFAQPRPGNLDSQVVDVIVIPVFLAVSAVVVLQAASSRIQASKDHVMIDAASGASAPAERYVAIAGASSGSMGTHMARQPIERESSTSERTRARPMPRLR